jgi:tetratricopeptide (TPR) repeat protein
MISRNQNSKSITGIIILFVYLFSANIIIAQQEIPDNIKDQILKGITALESAKIPVDIDEALALFEEAILLAPKYPDAHYFLGKTLSLIQGNSGKAVKELKKYLEMSPEAPDKEKVLGEIAKLEEAIKIKNKSYLMGLSLIKLSDGIYIRQVSPDFIARPV